MKFTYYIFNSTAKLNSILYSVFQYYWWKNPKFKCTIWNCFRNRDRQFVIGFGVEKDERKRENKQRKKYIILLAAGAATRDVCTLLFSLNQTFICFI